MDLSQAVELVEVEAIRLWNNSESVSLIWTKIGTTKQLDPKNKLITAFLKLTS